ERDYVLRHSDTSLVLVQDALLKHRYVDEIDDAYPGLADGERVPDLPFLRRVVPLSRWESFVAEGAAISGALVDAAAAQVEPSDHGIVIYTSGTTAHPKGVLHNQ